MTSTPTGATVAQRVPAKAPKRLYTMTPGYVLPAKIQRNSAATADTSVPMAAMLILPKESLTKPIAGRPSP